MKTETFGCDTCHKTCDASVLPFHWIHYVQDTSTTVHVGRKMETHFCSLDCFGTWVQNLFPDCHLKADCMSQNRQWPQKESDA
jgi:hypothetical protein